MHRTSFTIVIVWLVTINFCWAQQTADKAANGKTKQILAYIADLPKQGKILSGQFAGYSPDTFNIQQINEISGQTGQIPAILGCDYACGWNFKTPSENIIDYTCNPALKDHWNKGGLVTINMHLPNPVSTNGGGYKDRWNLNFADLTQPYSETGKRWRLFLDRIAEGLNDLQRAGVSVLFRPLHEMNGDWFYWCDQNPDTFKNVWKDMFNYLTNVKNLHNILWIYSPDQSRIGPSKFYPGDAYVDIVALDVYVDDPNSMKGYQEMLGLNKPFALGEVGPQNTNGQFDYTRWLTAIKSKFPRVAYFLAWNDNWSPIRNQNAYSFFNNKQVINRGKISINGGSTSESDISSSSFGTVLYSFSNGIGEWKGTNVIGGPWQSNEFIVKSTESLKADIILQAGARYVLYTQQKSSFKLNDRKKLFAQARVASWGFSNNGKISAKLYIKTGSAWKWYDSGEFQLNSKSATTLTLNLSQISSTELNDVQEIGVEYISNENGSNTAIYLSHITAE